MSLEVPQWNYGLRINEYINNSAMLIFSLKLATIKLSDSSNRGQL